MQRIFGLICTLVNQGHQNIIQYCNRPFSSVDEMDSTILRNWRNTIKGDDTLINLGDFCFKNWSKERLQTTLGNLPGYKILILGNHDRHHSVNWWRESGFDEVYPYPIIYRRWYILSHEDVFLNDKLPYINIHGHRHQVKLDKPYYINVSVECINYTPVLFDSIIPPAPEISEEDKWIPTK